MQHVKEQNWFAVGLDVVVVIVGIFLGMQVTDWNESRQFDENEKILLSQLKNEISTNRSLTANRIQFMHQVIDSGERAINYLESEYDCAQNCWPILVDFFAASQSLFSPAISNVYGEMRRLGLPRSVELKSKVEQYYTLNATIFSSVDRTPRSRQLIRELMTSKALKVLWENCHYVDGALEKLVLDCEQQLSDEEIMALLTIFKSRPELLEYLHHWIGMHYLWVPTYESQLKSGQDAIQAIDNFLGIEESNQGT